MILLHNIYGLLQGCYKGVRLAVQRPTIWDYGLKDQGLSVQSQISRLKRLRAPGVEASVGVRDLRAFALDIVIENEPDRPANCYRFQSLLEV